MKTRVEIELVGSGRPGVVQIQLSAENHADEEELLKLLPIFERLEGRVVVLNDLFSTIRKLPSAMSLPQCLPE